MDCDYRAVAKVAVNIQGPRQLSWNKTFKTKRNETKASRFHSVLSEDALQQALLQLRLSIGKTLLMSLLKLPHCAACDGVANRLTAQLYATVAYQDEVIIVYRSIPTSWSHAEIRLAITTPTSPVWQRDMWPTSASGQQCNLPKKSAE